MTKTGRGSCATTVKLEVGVGRTVAVLGGWDEGTEDVVHMELFSCTEGSKVILY